MPWPVSTSGSSGRFGSPGDTPYLVDIGILKVLRHSQFGQLFDFSRRDVLPVKLKAPLVGGEDDVTRRGKQVKAPGNEPDVVSLDVNGPFHFFGI